MQHLSCTAGVQVENACLSHAVLNHLKVAPTGWDKFFWPCRLERFAVNPTTTVVIDGCHNGDSLRKFLEDLRSLYPNRGITMVFGAGHEKCVSEMIDVLFDTKGADRVLMVASKHFRAMSEDELMQHVPVSVCARTKLFPIQKTETLEAKELGQRLQWAIDNNSEGYGFVELCCTMKL
jgi:folylpolyglutamate synthase/dihydropteroate synthase